MGPALRVTTSVERDQSVMLRINPAQFRQILKMRGERASPRICYQEPHLELMSPSRSHEAIKELIGRLLETWADEKDVELFSLGSMTLKTAGAKQAIEADGSYLIETTEGDIPHLAIEVVWTHEFVNGLNVYASLGVKEVWVWQNEKLNVFVLRRGRYVHSLKSSVLKDFDLAEFRKFLARWAKPQGLMKAYRAALRRH